MHSICPMLAKPNLGSRQENYVNEIDLKNINFDNIVKLNVSGAFPKKKNCPYNQITQIDVVPVMKKNISLPMQYDLLDDAFERFCSFSKQYKNNKLEEQYQLLNRINEKFAKNSQYAIDNNNSPLHLQNSNEVTSMPQFLGKKREIMFESIQKPLDNGNHNIENQDDYELSLKHPHLNYNKDEDNVNNATQNSSNNEPSSISMKCLHKIKKIILKIGSKYQTIHYSNQKELLFSISNYVYSITITREYHKITLLKKTELHKKETQYTSDKEILLELQKVMKGLKYLITKQKAIEQ